MGHERRYRQRKTDGVESDLLKRRHTEKPNPKAIALSPTADVKRGARKGREAPTNRFCIQPFRVSAFQPPLFAPSVSFCKIIRVNSHPSVCAEKSIP